MQNSQVITGTVKRKLIVKSGQAIELTSTAKTSQIEVQSGGSLDIEGAQTKAIKASGASVIRICAAKVTAAIKIVSSSGPVTIGDGEACAANTIAGALRVTGGSGGTTVTNNKVSKGLTVTGNSGEVLDSPNTVGGKSKVQ